MRERWKRVKRYVEVRRKVGATVAFGGGRPADLPGECFIQSTVLLDVENDEQIVEGGYSARRRRHPVR